MRGALISAFQIVTVGLPFCAFKVLTGFSIVSHGDLPGVGEVLIAWGIVDALINSTNLFALAFRRQALWGLCLTHILAQSIHLKRASQNEGSAELRQAHEDLGIALDIFLSFALISAMIGFGRLRDMPSPQIQIWNLAVILNVFGAGLGRITSSAHSLRQSKLPKNH